MKKPNLIITKDLNKFIDYAGLILIGVLSLGYSLYSSRFAKLHLALPFLRVPIFIGDMVFVICFLLFLIKWRMSRKKIGPLGFLFIAYFGFVFIKTISGYFFWGPLALRHSVLFLYPLFAIFAGSFFRVDFFKPKKSLFFIAIFFVLFILSWFFYFYNYSALTCFLLTLILINSSFKRPQKIILFILLFIIFPYKIIFSTARTFIVSNLLAIIYTSLGFLAISRYRKKVRFIIFLLIIVFIFYGIRKNSSPNEIKSLIGIKLLINEYNKGINEFHLAERNFVAPRLTIKLYNEKTAWFQESAQGETEELSQDQVFGKNIPVLKLSVENNVKISTSSEINRNSRVQSQSFIPLNKSRKNNIILPEEGKGVQVDETKKIQFEEAKKLQVEETKKAQADNAIRERGLGVPYSNSLFRIFIWKDAFSEMKIKKPIFGFDFGKPFRSRMIEVLRLAFGEWSRDGWICFHNSYIDVVYRAGIAGILMIVFILTTLFLFIKKSFQARSFTGILLTGILINWFSAANFLDIFQIPYSAIPLWSLFGLTAAYLFKSKSR